MSAYLCEIGLKFYQQGRYDEALHEFQKALMVEPNYEPALRYIRTIEQMGMPQKEEVIPPSFKPESKTSSGAIQEILDLVELQQEMLNLRKSTIAYGPALPQPALLKAPATRKEAKSALPPPVLALDDSLSKIPQPINIELHKSIILAGKNIQRFLVTQPNILSVTKKSPDELLLTGTDIGYTYLHVWDDNGRWTTEWLGVFPPAEGPTYEEEIRRREESGRNFKLNYSLDWAAFETGSRFYNMGRTTYNWTHSLGLSGPTPYGDIDSAITIRKDYLTHADLTYATIGLTNARIGPFKDFTIRGLDFNPPFYNLAFPGETLRGGMLSSPAFNKKIEYTAFWGREGGGRYGNLSPTLAKTKNLFLEGFNLNFSPTKIQDYQFSLLHGWGRDRDPLLSKFDYDLMTSWNFEQWGVDYEVAYDSKKFANLLNTHYRQPKIDFTTQLRDINKSFNSIIGTGWDQGERGALFNLNYTPTEKLNMTSSLNFYQTRLYPAEDNENRWNQDFNWNASYQFDPLTSTTLNYSLSNDLGQISQYRYQDGGFSLNRKFKLFRDIDMFIDYDHKENKSYTSHSSDYIDERFFAGIRFSLIGQLYYYLNKEINWLKIRYTHDRAMPNALETGLEWSDQVGSTPFYGDFRFTYRDEEDTESPLSFLSGEDYIEGYTELSYRPTDGTEIYGSCRVRNVWADNPSVTKHIEATLNGGLRYVWDTGLRWESVGSIEGYVFKDFNSDGLRQRDEPPVEGVKVWLGKDKFQVTDIFGYYQFKQVKARKAYVSLDTSTLPRGFILTVPVTQEVAITHHRISRIDFGIISRSEISGYVFEDTDGDGQYTRNDKGIKGVTLILDKAKTAVTDNSGRYSFTNAPVGEHTISVDLDTLPIYYLPKSAIIKKISLFEGVTYIYNIPLKRIEE